MEKSSGEPIGLSVGVVHRAQEVGHLLSFEVVLHVLEEFMLPRYLCVALKVVDDLKHIVTQPVEVDLSRHGSPSEVEMALLDIWSLAPHLVTQRASFSQSSLDEGGVVARVYLKLETVLP
eukprot:CAMPEP_0170507226 /NCGR_PEP_ID=MMETSP0208-20121228/58103_1 /TAXON_ID=197538 /ORGANISM="Strombidium inclinatum, Strain S3" /LENGTH=119 /DNA_ID=CAMNT_0010789273 /DNA_START=160 /DNA_END=518 /DNA_ORIENTATION=+